MNEIEMVTKDLVDKIVSHSPDKRIGSLIDPMQMKLETSQDPSSSSSSSSSISGPSCIDEDVRRLINEAMITERNISSLYDNDLKLYPFYPWF